MLILHYPACSTCRKALKWLTEHELPHTPRHIVEQNPTAAELREWISRSGLPIARWFNTSGLIYKERGLKDVVKTASDDELIDLLASEGKLVKRPILLTDDGRVLLGFKEAEWEMRLLD
ncbi:MAG: arsenate reductase family protein [Bacteroidales bacterium]|nr:arsenate reductase family protein [Bacteroidales bacterium]